MFFLILRVQIGTGVHLASCKMCRPIGALTGVSNAKCRSSYLFPVQWLRICGPLHSHFPGAFMACNRDTFTLPFYVSELCITYSFSISNGLFSFISLIVINLLFLKMNVHWGYGCKGPDRSIHGHDNRKR